MSDRATCWSVTINNPVASDEDRIAEARQKGWKVEGQLEKGDNGTPHYQLMVSTPQVRFSAVKKAFPRAHIEVCRNKTALASYVKKTETREGELPETESKYPSQANFFKMVTETLFDVDKRLRVSFSDGSWYSERGGDEEQRLLDALDEATRYLIIRGYHVETMAVNPQTRSAWKKFGMYIIRRSMAELFADRQTDRQTEIKSRPPSIPNDAGEDSPSEAECDSQSGSEDEPGEDDYGEDDSPPLSSGDEGSEGDSSEGSGY